MILDGFENIADWEAWLVDKYHQDEEYLKIAKELYTTINQDSFRTMFWDKKQLL